MRHVLLLCSVCVFLSSFDVSAQTTRKVLFLGNSYTGYNNLPQLVKDVALSARDTLIFESNTPGGYTLEDHSQNTTSQNKIKAGGWDYVALQGQSQEPITNTSRFKNGANVLDQLITQHNPCGVTMLYMTWGRKNGDASNCPSFPVMCTYEGMDSTLRNEYLDLAETLNAEVSPVSVVWHHLRQNNPGIELYNPDESHPSKAGSYAAACSFYAMIFKADPTAITYNFGLPAADAAAIRNAAKTEVFDQLSQWDYKRLPKADIQYQIGGGTNEVHFGVLGYGVRQSYHWDFGDGDTATGSNPTHSYAANGTYTVTLTATNCDLQGLHTYTTDTVISFCAHTPTIYTSNPWLCNYDTLFTQPADTYQWYSEGVPIPETGPFLSNYQRYNGLNFSVGTTVNGCTEQSQVYNANPVWSGFYFDAAWGGDPCEGDTALFIALNANGPISDSTIILWYKNGALLPSFTNHDTLLITTEGSYICKVVDTTAQCPEDTTTSSPVVFDCGTLGTSPTDPPISLHLYPNPASTHITLEFPSDAGREAIWVYNATGRLMKVVEATSPVTLHVADWPSGLYYVRVAVSRKAALSFVKY